MLRYKSIRCNSEEYTLLHSSKCSVPVYPYLRSQNGDKTMYCLSPLHGRSYVVGRMKNGRYVVSKGNGLSYTQSSFIHTMEFGDDTFGLLLYQDAIRDFLLGREIESLGIKTNKMEYVLQIEKEISLPSGHTLKPILLQYDVECPWRICDSPFMSYEQISEETTRWSKKFNIEQEASHMIAARVMIQNLRILHDHGILHNAIHEQNYTWALELLDFELSCSPSHPYDEEDYCRHVKDLFPREIIQTYNIVNYIAGVLHEEINFKNLDDLFAEYGFEIKKYEINLK